MDEKKVIASCFSCEHGASAHHHDDDGRMMVICTGEAIEELVHEIVRSDNKSCKNYKPLKEVKLIERR